MDNELVSIIIPIYNMGEKVQLCVQSICRQTYSNVEIILIDDGSVDNSLAVCRQLAAADDRIKVYHTENRGSGPARNHGIEMSNGRYAYFPDADDYMEPNTIERLVEAVQGCDLVVFGFKNIRHDGRLVWTKSYQEEVVSASVLRQDYSDCMSTRSRRGIQGAPWNKFFDLDIIRTYNIKYPPLRRHQDDGFIARYMCHSQKVHYIPDILYTYYVNDIGLEWNKYPYDYILAVTGLFDVRRDTILQWCENDFQTHNLVYREFVQNVIKSMELSFAPKHNLTYRERLHRFAEIVEECRFKDRLPEKIKGLGLYHRTAFSLINARCYHVLHLVLFLKIIVHKLLR